MELFIADIFDLQLHNLMNMHLQMPCQEVPPHIMHTDMNINWPESKMPLNTETKEGAKRLEQFFHILLQIPSAPADLPSGKLETITFHRYTSIRVISHIKLYKL